MGILGIIKNLFKSKKEIKKIIFIRYNGMMIMLQVLETTSLYNILKLTVDLFWKKYSQQLPKPEDLYLVAFNYALTDLKKTVKDYMITNKRIFDLRFRSMRK